MASATDGQIDEILDDLQLNHVILQSLQDERPDAIEERNEILETIQQLEDRLRELRGQPSRNAQRPSGPSQDTRVNQDRNSTSATPSTSHSNPPQWGRSARSPPSRPPAISPPGDSSHTLGPLSIRKRHRDDEGDYDSDDTDDLEIPTKRVAKSRPPASLGVASSPPSSYGGEQPDGADDLRRILGLDSRERLRALQDEQRQAEQWLEDRKEQERRDEEYARKLMEGFDDEPPSSPPRINTSHSSIHSSHVNPAQSPFRPHGSPMRPMNSMNPMDSQRQNLPSFGSIAPHPSHPSTGHRSIFGAPSMSGSQHMSYRQPPVLIESDDSDVAEVSAKDFPRSPHRNLFPRDSPSRSWHPVTGSVKSNAYAWMNRDSRHPTLQNSFPNLPAPGPSATQGPSSAYGPSVLQNTMARISSGRQMFEQFGKNVLGDIPNPFARKTPLPGVDFPEYPGYSDLMREYEDLDPKKTNEEIKQLLETIRPDSDISIQNREGTPEALQYSLLEHQKLGLAWMKSMEEKDQKGGILADDMGLGKTIQAIALMASRPSEDPARKPTLIIAPVALMQQWKREIERILRPGKYQFSIYVLHGEKRAITFRDIKKYDVVLTTFGTLASELKRKEHYDERQKAGANEYILQELSKSLPCLGPSSLWYRIIIDEAQCIKNRNTKAAIACCQLNATYRWCMSGTPMMNNVEELHSLLKFLRIRPYNNLERFNRDFTKPLKNGSLAGYDRAMTQLQVLLKAVLLRRTKESKIDGRPILQLPRRISEKVHAAFSDDELELYKSLETKTQIQFNKYLEAGTVGRNYSNILVLLLRLRQACCHPHLITDFSVKLNANTNELDLVANARNFSNEVIVRLRDNTDMECPICIDAVENPVIFFPCGHSTCAECFSRISDPAIAVRQGHDGSVEVKCPNCRGKVDPKKITDHLSFKQVHYGESDGTEESETVNPTPADDDDESDDDDDDDDDNKSNASLSGFIVNDDEDEESTSRPSRKKKGKMAAKKDKKTLAELKKDASKNVKSKRKYLRRLEKTWITSAKIEKALEILDTVQNAPDNEKIIIFSQFTSLLDLLEVPISRRGWGYRRYDGSMKPVDRNSAVLDFTDDPRCRIMLVSLKAGNSGLNLVAASHVIIFDPFWNPYIEEQAIDRAHRIGQMREVKIHRILVPDTVEDRILELQDKKRELIEGALDEKASKNVARLGTRELAYLFGVN